MNIKKSLEIHETYLDQFFRYIKLFKSKFLGSVVYSILNNLFDLLPELVLGLALDSIICGEKSRLGKLGLLQISTQFLFIAIVIFVVYALQAFCQYTYSIKWWNFSLSLQHFLRKNLFDKILNAKIKSFSDKENGDMISIGNDDIANIGHFFEGTMILIIKLIFTCLFVSIYFFLVSYKIALTSLLPLPILFLVSLVIHKNINALYRDVSTRSGQISVSITNGILGFYCINNLSAKNIEISKLNQRSLDYTESSSLARRKTAIICPIVNLSIAVSCITTIVFGGKMVLMDTLDIGTFSTLILLVPSIMAPFIDLFDIMTSTEKMLSSARRVIGLINIEQESSGKVFHDFKGNISLKNVSFAYSDESSFALKNLNIEILANQKVAFVGPIGSGKSTIAKLLTNMYSPTDGAIEYDSLDLKNIISESLRAQVCFVEQAPFIFDGTISENIAYGLDNVAFCDIEEVAKKVFLHDYIASLKNGYDTLLSRKQTVLSGGQCQLIAIARALIRKPKIFVLDEIATALDPEIEHTIQKALSFFDRETTVIVFTQKLSIIKSFDVICLLNNGSIV